LNKAAEQFELSGAEITLEANPAENLSDVFHAFVNAGGNRLSMGMQSAHADELRYLGRRHTPEQVERAAEAAYAAGLTNLSLDIMLGIEGQTRESVVDSVRECKRLGAKHISAYLLKIEEGTPFYKSKDQLQLPDEDAAVERYLAAGETLDAAGYTQYEISNFAVPGFESRHNLKYWNEEPYLGIGPAAHSFIGGKRFYYPRDISSFIRGAEPLTESDGDSAITENSVEEYLMLRLRLTKGVTEQEFMARFGREIPIEWRERAKNIPPHLLVNDNTGIRLTREGFLLSNAIIGKLILS
jgi:oxygen-independent coproporphyrinogen-3 oxidase